MPKGFAGSGVAVLNGKIYVIGGCADSCGVTDVQVFDPTSGDWSAVAAYTESTSWLACGGVNGGGACGFYKIGGSVGGLSPMNGSEVLPGYDLCADVQDVSWLSEDGTEMTLAPGAGVEITLTLNANVPDITQPGTYHAALAIGTDTPYRYQPIAVTATVNPPTTPSG